MVSLQDLELSFVEWCLCGVRYAIACFVFNEFVGCNIPVRLADPRTGVALWRRI